MITNRFVEIIIGILSLITMPVAFITTLIIGAIVTITFGILLFPINLIWITLFYGPLLFLSYIYEKVPILRLIISIIGIPVAVLGYEFSALMPSMGEKESRVSKLLFCTSFPYSWNLFYFVKTSPFIKYSKGFNNLHKVFDRIPYKDKLTRDYIIKLKATYEVSNKFA